MTDVEILIFIKGMMCGVVLMGVLAIGIAWRYNR